MDFFFNIGCLIALFEYLRNYQVKILRNFNEGTALERPITMPDRIRLIFLVIFLSYSSLTIRVLSITIMIIYAFSFYKYMDKLNTEKHKDDVVRTAFYIVELNELKRNLFLSSVFYLSVVIILEFIF